MPCQLLVSEQGEPARKIEVPDGMYFICKRKDRVSSSAEISSKWRRLSDHYDFFSSKGRLKEENTRPMLYLCICPVETTIANMGFTSSISLNSGSMMLFRNYKITENDTITIETFNLQITVSGQTGNYLQKDVQHELNSELLLSNDLISAEKVIQQVSNRSDSILEPPSTTTVLIEDSSKNGEKRETPADKPFKKLPEEQKYPAEENILPLTNHPDPILNIQTPYYPSVEDLINDLCPVGSNEIETEIEPTTRKPLQVPNLNNDLCPKICNEIEKEVESIRRTPLKVRILSNDLFSEDLNEIEKEMESIMSTPSHSPTLIDDSCSKSSNEIENEVESITSTPQVPNLINDSCPKTPNEIEKEVKSIMSTPLQAPHPPCTFQCKFTSRSPSSPEIEQYTRSAVFLMPICEDSSDSSSMDCNSDSEDSLIKNKTNLPPIKRKLIRRRSFFTGSYNI